MFYIQMIRVLYKYIFKMPKMDKKIIDDKQLKWARGWKAVE